jgi:hypothetical protein
MDIGRHKMGRPLVTNHDAFTGITEVREMNDEEYAALIESGWTEESTGEQAAPQPVEEEEPSDAQVADSSSPSSDS